jgi:hypothetical protein
MAMGKKKAKQPGRKKTASPTPKLPSANALPFVMVGTESAKIDVQISYRIIELFSQGLYRSPTKAIEELVSNAYDAGATIVHVVIDPDLLPPDATIAVIDNGTGMDADGLRLHWLIGVSNKRQPDYSEPKGRQQIGRFGIGKLATYVLAQGLTHVSKSAGKYFATTMNYAEIPHSESGGIQTEAPVRLPLRELTSSDAQHALQHWLGKDKPGYQAIRLFGRGSEKNWTVAILSELKEMARELKRGRLRWVLSTAMPLRDDFQLFLDGDRVSPSKVTTKRIRSWVFGKHLIDVPNPAPDNLQATEDTSMDKKSIHRFGLTHPQLGRVTGYAELYEDLLTGGKSADIGRSHGFFVYCRQRLINIDDEYFGIDSNLLRHGTFARLRMVAHIDRLDDELRSSRESIREGPLLEIARNLLHGAFKYVRIQHGEYEQEQAPGTQAAQRIAATPASLARRPLVAMVTKALDGVYTPLYTTCPKNLTDKAATAFLQEVAQRADSSEGLVTKVQFVEESPHEPLAKFEVATGTLSVNSLHPYIAHFLDEYEHKTRVPLELLGMSEVLLEAHLFELGLDGKTVRDALCQRDELLRSLSRATGKRNARLIAQALQDAGTNQSALETELVAAFDSMGFDNAVRIGGSGKPDGLAEALLGATETGVEQSYRVSLEAKSKERPGTKVSAKSVGVSGIVRQRDDFKATFAVVVGPDFPTSKKENSALAKEIQADRQNNPRKGITLIRIEDMSRLVRLVPAKRIGLNRLRGLFEKCSLPEESKAWIDGVADEKMTRPPYREVLEAIASEQQDMPTQAVEYAHLETCLRKDKKIVLPRAEIVELCRALSKMAPGFVYARHNTVELTQRPDKVLEAMMITIREYPEDEQKTIPKPK